MDRNSRRKVVRVIFRQVILIRNDKINGVKIPEIETLHTKIINFFYKEGMMCISLTRSMVVPSFLLLLVMVLESHAESYTVGSIDRQIYCGLFGKIL